MAYVLLDDYNYHTIYVSTDEKTLCPDLEVEACCCMIKGEKLRKRSLLLMKYRCMLRLHPKKIHSP